MLYLLRDNRSPSRFRKLLNQAGNVPEKLLNDKSIQLILVRALRDIGMLPTSSFFLSFNVFRFTKPPRDEGSVPAIEFLLIERYRRLVNTPSELGIAPQRQVLVSENTWR